MWKLFHWLMLIFHIFRRRTWVQRMDNWQLIQSRATTGNATFIPGIDTLPSFIEPQGTQYQPQLKIDPLPGVIQPQDSQYNYQCEIDTSSRSMLPQEWQRCFQNETDNLPRITQLQDVERLFQRYLSETGNF